MPRDWDASQSFLPGQVRGTIARFRNKVKSNADSKVLVYCRSMWSQRETGYAGTSGSTIRSHQKVLRVASGLTNENLLLIFVFHKTMI